ncbi:MAG: hypothetical protein QM729_13460 [Solirubrobacterales bacterium]
MALSEEDELRVEGELLRMTEELRDRPSQEKEDRIGVEIGLLGEEERAFVPTALLRLLVREREGRMGELEPQGTPLPRRRRFGPFG